MPGRSSQLPMPQLPSDACRERGPETLPNSKVPVEEDRSSPPKAEFVQTCVRSKPFPQSKGETPVEKRLTRGDVRSRGTHEAPRCHGAARAAAGTWLLRLRGHREQRAWGRKDEKRGKEALAGRTNRTRVHTHHHRPRSRSGGSSTRCLPSKGWPLAQPLLAGHLEAPVCCWLKREASMVWATWPLC